MHSKLHGLRLAVLDWSGTLSRDGQLIYEANRRLLRRYGLPHWSYDECRDGRETNASIILAERHGCPAADFYPEFAAILAAVKRELGEPEPYPGVREFFRALAGAHITPVIVTSHVQAELKVEMLALDLPPIEVRAGVTAKAREIQDVCARARVAAAEAFYLGDTRADMEAAKQADVVAVGISHGYHSAEVLRQAEADLVVSSLALLYE